MASLRQPSSISRFVTRFLLLPAALVSFEGAHAVDAPAAIPTVVVHVKSYLFSPNQLTLKKGRTIKILLISDDVLHGLAVRGLGVRTEVPAGHPTEVTVTPSQVGDFPGTCSVYCGSGHKNMTLMIHVVE